MKFLREYRYEYSRTGKLSLHRPQNYLSLRASGAARGTIPVITGVRPKRLGALKSTTIALTVAWMTRAERAAAALKKRRKKLPHSCRGPTGGPRPTRSAVPAPGAQGLRRRDKSPLFSPLFVIHK